MLLHIVEMRKDDVYTYCCGAPGGVPGACAPWPAGCPAPCGVD